MVTWIVVSKGILPAQTHTAGIRIVRRTARDREHADTGRGDLVLRGGGGGLRGGGYTGEDEDGDESADNKLHGMGPFEVLFVKLLITDSLRETARDLAAESHSAGIRIIRSAAGDGQHADLGDSHLVFGGSGGGLGGSNCTGEDEDGDEGADDVFHSGIPPKLYLLEKISLDNPDEVTIG